MNDQYYLISNANIISFCIYLDHKITLLSFSNSCSKFKLNITIEGQLYYTRKLTHYLTVTPVCDQNWILWFWKCIYIEFHLEMLTIICSQLHLVINQVTGSKKISSKPNFRIQKFWESHSSNSFPSAGAIDPYHRFTQFFKQLPSNDCLKISENEFLTLSETDKICFPSEQLNLIYFPIKKSKVDKLRVNIIRLRLNLLRMLPFNQVKQ